MKLHLFALLLPILFLVSGNQKASAFDIGVGIGGHHHGGGHVEFRTSDPVYSTWYPSDRTYVYTPPVYYNDGTTYYYDSPSTSYYTTPTYVYPDYSTGVEFNTWYGGGRHYSHDRWHRR